ncbi:concanavalin A-like lectin/glucanase domain-containing protein [Chaetomium sp. MPI-CAGE-AT-0009]|nr:concanavalin A-like lectin/glucanase domain-containing protein [Chaetomium sp. MPI-CAGE-AT-0009]
MASARSLSLVVVASMVTTTQGAHPLTTDSNCHCYHTNATVTNYFSHHQFFDFRALHQYAGVPEPIDSFEANAEAAPSSAFFSNSDLFTNSWAIMNWNNTALLDLNNSTLNDAKVKMVNSPNNIYIERDQDQPQTTHMTLRTVRHAEFQSSAEFESVSQGYQFLSVRMHARTKGAAGAVTAMFTYRPPPESDDIGLVQEADLEILTRDPPSYVQYTNQPAWNSTSDIPEATRNTTLPDGRRWTDWAEYRMDWTPGSTTWFVNGQLASHITFQAPRDPAQVMFNTWSDGGSWSGNMTVGGEAYMQIRWIDMVYNSTDPGAEPGGGCRNVCSIDETTKIGTPVLLTGGPQACVSAKYGQCAGRTWNGCQSCEAGSTCRFQNDFYSQCL